MTKHSGKALVHAPGVAGSDDASDTAADVWAAYHGYSNTLRTWLVAA